MRRRGEIVLGDKRIYSRLSRRFRRRTRRVVIVAAVLIYVAWAARSVGEETKKKQAMVDISRIEHVTRLFRADEGRCPDDLEEMISSRWNSRYSAPNIDPWGKPYHLQCPARYDPGGARVYSGGPDGESNGDDDITSL